MAITASAVTPDKSLEEFRVEFNKLVQDFDGVSSGNTFDQSIIFEGATADAYETTLIVTDPTADNTIELPNVGATGTNPGGASGNAKIITTMNSDTPTTTTSSSDADFILVDDGGIMKKISAANLGVGTPSTITLAATNTTDATHYPMFSSAATGDEEPRTDTGLTYNPNSGLLTTAAVTTTAAIIVGTTVSIVDDQKLILGSNSDISLRYDETTTDSFIISSDVDSAALGIILQADRGDDAGDEWKLNIADGGVLTLGNDIASAGTHATLLTITPNSTAANSTHAFVGKLSASGGITVPNDGDVGSTGATDAIQISSGGIVTFKDDILIKDGGTIGVASSTSAITIASTGIVTLVDDLLLKDACTIGTATTAGAVSIAADGTVNLATAGATVNSAVIKTAGTETIYVPASAMYPTTTAGCAALVQVEGTAGRPELKCLDFDPSSDENAQFTVAFPKSWNAGTITFRAFFTVTGTNTGTVSWSLAGGSTADNGVIDTAFGTAVAPTAKAHSGTSNDIDVTVVSGAVTIANVADDTMTFFNIERDVSADSQTGDARLLGIQIFYTTSAATDA
jgi:hypothetical protein